MNSRYLEEITELRHRLHSHPELSGEERWTKAQLMAFLGERTDLELVDRGSWFYAVYRSATGRRSLAFRADMDAIHMEESLKLPWASQVAGVAHKCGHDGHSAVLAGLALEIDRLGSDNTIFFLFQHAEETGAGAAQCLQLLEEQQVDEIFAFHNMSGLPFATLAVKPGVINYASKGLCLHFTGAPAHASAPEKGSNPALAIAKIVASLAEFTSPLRNEGEVVSTVVQIAVGEAAYGVSPGEGVLRLTIRAHFEAEMRQLEERIVRLAQFLAEEEGLQVVLSSTDSFPETRNHADSVARLQQAAAELGMESLELAEPWRFSEDFGHYLQRVPGAICYLGNGVEYPHIHTHQYDFPDALLPRACGLFLKLARGG